MSKDTSQTVSQSELLNRMNAMKTGLERNNSALSTMDRNSDAGVNHAFYFAIVDAAQKLTDQKDMPTEELNALLKVVIKSEKQSSTHDERDATGLGLETLAMVEKVSRENQEDELVATGELKDTLGKENEEMSSDIKAESLEEKPMIEGTRLINPQIHNKHQEDDSLPSYEESEKAGGLALEKQKKFDEARAAENAQSDSEEKGLSITQKIMFAILLSVFFAPLAPIIFPALAAALPFIAPVIAPIIAAGPVVMGLVMGGVVAAGSAINITASALVNKQAHDDKKPSNKAQLSDDIVNEEMEQEPEQEQEKNMKDIVSQSSSSVSLLKNNALGIVDSKSVSSTSNVMSDEKSNGEDKGR